MCSVQCYWELCVACSEQCVQLKRMHELAAHNQGVLSMDPLHSTQRSTSACAACAACATSDPHKCHRPTFTGMVPLYSSAVGRLLLLRGSSVEVVFTIGDGS